MQVLTPAVPSAAKTADERQEWIFGNPWLWTLLGLAICLACWSVVAFTGESLNDLGLSVLFLGLLAAAAGVVVRLGSSAPVSLSRLSPRLHTLVLLGLTLLFALLVVTISVLVGQRYVDSNPLHWRVIGANPIQWRLAGLVMLWLIVCPLSIAAAVSCARRLRLDCRLTTGQEGAAVLAVAALTTFCACRALYNADSPEDWDSMRLFLAALLLVPLGAAPLLLVSQPFRRLIISVLIVLHFAGIGLAAASPTPSPWIVGQLWARMYQPYLEFMYLNNAYHFYSPEPGPASFLWFRMFYEDSEGKEWAHWLKIPDVDEDGWHKNTLALEYQRMLAVTENVVPTETVASIYVTRPDGTSGYADWYANRIMHSTNLADSVPIVGQRDPVVTGLRVPYPTYLTLQQQHLRPNLSSRTMLSSYARHVCLEPHPTHPERRIKRVKIYRVVHRIPEIYFFVNESIDPRDPVNYLPYYMGAYDPAGRLLDESRFDVQGNLVQRGDPFLFWLLPMLRDNPLQVKSPIKSWLAKHAGDPDWVYTYDESKKRHVIALGGPP